MKYEVKIPAVGESITEATIGGWVKKNGEAVKKNEIILMVETDKASVEVIAEQDGVLSTSAEQGKVVPIGSVVGFIDSDGKATAAAPTATPQTAPAMTATTPPPAPTAAAHLSPAVQRIVAETGVNPANVTGTGKDGRVTKGDLLTTNAATTLVAPAAKASVTAPTAPTASVPPAAVPANSGTENRVPMTTIRKRIAERLVQAQSTAAILTTFNEIDMSRLMDIRSKYKEKFKEKYGLNLGYMGFFAKAVVEALKAWPAVNARIDGNDIVYHNFYHLGVAVSTEKGLMVPVLKNCDHLSIAQIEAAIRDLALRGRDGKIKPDELSGGTFSITNGGTFGSLLSTPILNPPQSGILGMHKIEDRAVVINGKVEVRPMMYVALSYDHRLIDGREAVSFLVKVKEGLEDPERLLLEI